MNKEIDEIAEGVAVEAETLTDESVVYNVLFTTNGTQRFGCTSKKQAYNLARLLADVAWSEDDATGGGKVSR